MREEICLCISAVEGSFPEGIGEVSGAVVETLPMGSFFTVASWKCRDRVENGRVDMGICLRTDDGGGVREVDKSRRMTLFGREVPFNARKHCVQV